jgi:hypothetical protein
MFDVSEADLCQPSLQLQVPASGRRVLRPAPSGRRPRPPEGPALRPNRSSLPGMTPPTDHSPAEVPREATARQNKSVQVLSSVVLPAPIQHHASQSHVAPKGDKTGSFGETDSLDGTARTMDNTHNG